MRAILQRGKKGSDPVAAEYGPVPRWGPPLSEFAAPWEQIGIYGDAYLNQFPAYYNQPQLHSGVEWLWDHWYVPTVSTLPYFVQTQGPQPIGGQRFGAPAGAPVGPLASKDWMGRVTQAQVAQSGAQALSWAAALTDG